MGLLAKGWKFDGFQWWWRAWDWGFTQYNHEHWTAFDLGPLRMMWVKK